ncbi:hypothetical protein BH23CHL7_BH23CHL7_05960 [soil metagenome]
MDRLKTVILGLVAALALVTAGCAPERTGPGTPAPIGQTPLPVDQTPGQYAP